MTRREQLRAPEVEARLAAIRQLAEHGAVDADELEALAECLGHERKVIQRRAVEAFAELDAGGVAVQPRLLACLRSESPEQRWGAAFALSLVRPLPAEALPVLVDALGVEDGDRRWAAANIVVHMAASADVVSALERLLRQGNAQQRKMAAYCLRDRNVRLPVVEATLAAALSDPDATVRLAAASSLARIACDRQHVAQSLIALLEDTAAGVRRAAAIALGVLGEPSEMVRGALHAAAAGHDPSLQRAAERSLRLLGR